MLGEEVTLISSHLWGLKDDTKCTEDVVQEFLIYLRVQVSNEDIGPHIQTLGIGSSLAYTHNKKCENFQYVLCCAQERKILYRRVKVAHPGQKKVVFE